MVFSFAQIEWIPGGFSDGGRCEGKRDSFANFNKILIPLPTKTNKTTDKK